MSAAGVATASAVSGLAMMPARSASVFGLSTTQGTPLVGASASGQHPVKATAIRASAIAFVERVSILQCPFELIGAGVVTAARIQPHACGGNACQKHGYEDKADHISSFHAPREITRSTAPQKMVTTTPTPVGPSLMAS